MDRRDFIKISDTAAANLTLAGHMPKGQSKRDEELFGLPQEGKYGQRQTRKYR